MHNVDHVRRTKWNGKPQNARQKGSLFKLSHMTNHQHQSQVQVIHPTKQTRMHGRPTLSFLAYKMALPAQTHGSKPNQTNPAPPSIALLCYCISSRIPWLT